MSKILLLILLIVISFILDQRFILLYKLTGQSYAFVDNSFFGNPSIWLKALNLFAKSISVVMIAVYVIIIFKIIKNRSYNKTNFAVCLFIFISGLYLYAIRNFDYMNYYQYFPGKYERVASKDLFRLNRFRGINCIKWEKLSNETYMKNSIVNYSWINPDDISASEIVTKDCLLEAGAVKPGTENHYLLVRLNVASCQGANLNIWKDKSNGQLHFYPEKKDGGICSLVGRDYDTLRFLIEYPK